MAALLSAAPELCLSALAGIIENPPAELSAGAFDAIARCFAAPSKTIRRRAADALAAVARHNPATIEQLRALLSDADPRMRFGAAYTLGSLGGAALSLEAASVLCEALGDSDGDVRWAAADLLLRCAEMHGERIHADLIALARSDNAAARKMALYCIRDLRAGRDEALEAARAAVADRDTHVRLAALALLSACFGGSETAAALMIERLESDSDRGVRRAAAAALGNAGCRSARAIEALRRAGAQPEDSSLARAARTSLDRITRS